MDPEVPLMPEEVDWLDWFIKGRFDDPDTGGITLSLRFGRMLNSVDIHLPTNIKYAYQLETFLKTRMGLHMIYLCRPVSEGGKMFSGYCRLATIVNDDTPNHITLCVIGAYTLMIGWDTLKRQTIPRNNSEHGWYVLLDSQDVSEPTTRGPWPFASIGEFLTEISSDKRQEGDVLQIVELHHTPEDGKLQVDPIKTKLWLPKTVDTEMITFRFDMIMGRVSKRDMHVRMLVRSQWGTDALIEMELPVQNPQRAVDTPLATEGFAMHSSDVMERATRLFCKYGAEPSWNLTSDSMVKRWEYGVTRRIFQTKRDESIRFRLSIYMNDYLFVVFYPRTNQSNTLLSIVRYISGLTGIPIAALINDGISACVQPNRSAPELQPRMDAQWCKIYDHPQANATFGELAVDDNIVHVRILGAAVNFLFNNEFHADLDPAFRNLRVI